MVEGIEGPTPDSLRQAAESRNSDVEKTQQRGLTETAGTDEDTATEVDSELEALLERVKASDAVRKEKVHLVSEKLASGELLSTEAIRGASERIAEEWT